MSSDYPAGIYLEINPILVREESSEPFMAMAYTRMTGKPGVCYTSRLIEQLTNRLNSYVAPSELEMLIMACFL
jgi:hypothetical protein